MLPFSCLKTVIWWPERPRRHSRELTLGLMGQFSLEPSQWKGSAPGGKPNMVLVSSLGEPRLSASPLGSPIQISFSKLYQTPGVLRWHGQGCWTTHPVLRVRGDDSPVNPLKLWALQLAKYTVNKAIHHQQAFFQKNYHIFSPLKAVFFSALCGQGAWWHFLLLLLLLRFFIA